MHKQEIISNKSENVNSDIPRICLNMIIKKKKLNKDAYKVEMRQGNSSSYEYTLLIKYDPIKKWIWRNCRHEFIGTEGEWTANYGKLTGGFVNSGRDGSRNNNSMKYFNDAC